MTLLRSLLFVPGNQARMLEKALTVASDVLVPDMEDSVPAAHKPDARETIRAFLPRLAAGGRHVVPRVNALDSEWFEQDLAAVVGAHIHGISIGKVASAGDVDRICQAIDALEERAVLAPGTVKLIPWIETARGITNCEAICLASTRIIAVAFGGEDFTHDMAIERLDDPAQLAYPRSRLCIAARAAGVAALDTPYFQFRDQSGLEADAMAARHIGFKGKFAIHPDQIEPINRTFAPSPAEIEHARRVLHAYGLPERALPEHGRMLERRHGHVHDPR